MPSGPEIAAEMPGDFVDIANEFAVITGKSMMNNTASAGNRQNFISITSPVDRPFRTKQRAFRLAAWLVHMAELNLPDEDMPSTFEDVLAAIEEEHEELSKQD